MRKTSLILVVALFICSTGLAAQPGVVELESLRSPGDFDRAAFQAEQQRLLAWLVAEQVEAGLAVPVSIELTDREIREIELGHEIGSQAVPSALLSGMVKPANLTFDLTAPSHGAIESAVDGGLVWTAAVHSDDAAGLRVHFTDFALPTGFELWFYSTNGVVRGPYTGLGPGDRGDFWSHTVAGPDAVLQLRAYGPAISEQVVSFRVTELGHVGRAAALKSFCSFNVDCIENVECTSDPAVDDARDAVALMRFIKRPFIYLCSGGLLNSSINPGAPYFLTANHCISRDREAGTLETWFAYTIACDGAGYDCTEPFVELSGPSTLGSSVLATNKTSDFTLLLLAEAPPAGSAFLGWSTAAVAFTDAAPLYRVSHPAGAPQAYSAHLVSTSAGTCSSWPRGSWIYSRDTTGATEGGSSGSPVVNADGLVVGQLSGGCGTNIGDECDAVNNATVDGAFSAYYDQVAPWLGTGGSCTDADGDGFCAPEDCDDGDPDVNPGAAEVCDDGIDNNCDGFIDENCGGCTDNDGDGYCAEVDDCDDNEFFANPGLTEICDDEIDNNCDGFVDEGCSSCLPPGEPCTTGADCCSERCHPKRNICK